MIKSLSSIKCINTWSFSSHCSFKSLKRTVKTHLTNVLWNCAFEEQRKKRKGKSRLGEEKRKRKSPSHETFLGAPEA